MSDKRPDGTREEIIRRLKERGWQEPALSREVETVLNGDRFDECPLKVAGFRLERLGELGTVVVGADDRCICTTVSSCLDVDKRDGIRCTVKQLKQLDDEARRRRAWQSGGD